ncbi:hypothetical protein [Streptomyces sp. NBC_01304]|uniref:hypothetical protein n=1 Tax=Streptomyces sp. NBC_01304 TaxID=2903818 RepID=UPI002E0DC56B|nr:hypothetical protein OG430_40490 [Streptomyces sp. NBC_01304]
MSTGFLIALLVVVVLIAGLLAVKFLVGKGASGLRRRFGPEYERTVAQYDGDTTAAKKDLDGRIHRHGNLKIHPLTAEAYDQYAAEWSYAQEEFVDDPAKAAAHADGILSGLAREHGFPADPYREQLAALSVHHPQHLESYRRLHAAVHRTDKGQANTEELRELFVHARAFYDDLAGERPGDPDTHHDADTDDSDEPERRPWGTLRRRDTSRGSTP